MPVDKIPSAGIDAGGVAPSNLSTGAPSWDASGNTNVTGRFTIPGQPLFFAFGNGSQSWSGASNTQILQLNTLMSLGSHPSSYNTSTYTFTAPVAGTYMFFGKITQTTTAAGPSASLYVNNNVPGPEFVICYNVAYMSASGFQMVQLAANDQVTMRVINFNNVSVTLDTTRCNFMGYLIG